MSRRRILAKDWIEEKRQERGVDLELPNGEVVFIDPPLFWQDGFHKIPSDDERALAIAVLGSEERLEQVVDAGLTPKLLIALASEMLAEGNVGESPASSSS